MRVTVLGCGATTGVPMIARGWGKCDPNNPRNRRLRSSILVEDGDTVILVDTSPDLREQMLAADVKRLDAVLYTHAHADHAHGIDDLRALNRAMNAAIPCYADVGTLNDLKRRFDYVFEPMAPGAETIYKPWLTDHEIRPGEPFKINATEITAFDQDHGFSRTLGFRFGTGPGPGSFAYSTDLTVLPEAAFPILDRVDTWIIGTLTETPHPTHAHVEKSLGWIGRIKPRQAVLTHLGVGLDYDELSAKLPEGVAMAYDGMVLETA
ncbi:MAG: MBL fold metallo-hydrolase [Rhodospirillales bacterium]